MQNHNSSLLIWSYLPFDGQGCTTITANNEEAESVILLIQIITLLLLITAALLLITQAWV